MVGAPAGKGHHGGLIPFSLPGSGSGRFELGKVLLRPPADSVERLDEASAKRRQRILDAGRDLPEVLAGGTTG